MEKKTKKRGDSDILMKVLVFLIPSLILLGFFFLVNKSSNQGTLNEQIYAKQIALSIDKAKPGTEIYLDVSKLYEIAIENKVKGEIIKIDNNEKSVWINLVDGTGYKFYFFSDVNVVWNLLDKEGKLYLKISK